MKYNIVPLLTASSIFFSGIPLQSIAAQSEDPNTVVNHAVIALANRGGYLPDGHWRLA